MKIPDYIAIGVLILVLAWAVADQSTRQVVVVSRPAPCGPGYHNIATAIVRGSA